MSMPISTFKEHTLSATRCVAFETNFLTPVRGDLIWEADRREGGASLKCTDRCCLPPTSSRSRDNSSESSAPPSAGDSVAKVSVTLCLAFSICGERAQGKIPFFGYTASNPPSLTLSVTSRVPFDTTFLRPKIGDFSADGAGGGSWSVVFRSMSSSPVITASSSAEQWDAASDILWTPSFAKSAPVIKGFARTCTIDR